MVSFILFLFLVPYPKETEGLSALRHPKTSAEPRPRRFFPLQRKYDVIRDGKSASSLQFNPTVVVTWLRDRGLYEGTYVPFTSSRNVCLGRDVEK